MTTDERIAALEARVDELSSRIDRLGRDSMHKTLTCPACGCGTILFLRQVREFVKTDGEVGTHVTVPLALGSRSDLGMGDQVFAYVCRDCRLVELHTQTLDRLLMDRENVDILNRAADVSATPDAPYR
jgi:hypothetical protein